jgi:radical SAM-linked protein
MLRWTPESLDKILTQEILPLVSKPNRYVGNELGLAEKDWDATEVRFLLCYPDVYEVGMSHTGTQILYHIVNRDPRWLLDRVYAPWPDMEAQLRRHELPLWGLQHRRPVSEYDILGFTLQSELTYTNILTVLDLACIPIRAADRTDRDPLIMIGGPCAANPEPLAPFVDLALIGDAEDALPEVLEIVGEWKLTPGGSLGLGATTTTPAELTPGGSLGSLSGSLGSPGSGKQQLLEMLATRVPGIYVPSLYEVPDGGRTARPTANAPVGTPFPVVARTVPVLRSADHPRRMIVSLTETTHDRMPIEVMRGCVRGCRFCQAGYLYRPARERDVDETVAIAEQGIQHSGWREVSLLSLSTADYSEAVELTDRMSHTMVDRGVSVSLPSLRADALSVGLAEAVSRVRKSGFTFAPEAGSQRLRDVINKGLTEAEILSAVDRAMNAGWTSIKLYYMIGHPTETEQDFEELAQLVERIRAILNRYPGRRLITLAFSPFVPKAHTPFQWERQDTIAATRTKLAWIKRRLKGRGVEIRHHDSADTAIEGVISRGGREISEVIEGAWRRGARFDGWSEFCELDPWEAALNDNGLTLLDSFRELGENEELPWEIVNYKIERRFFLKERHKAYQAGLTPECKHERCSACGVCDFQAMRNVLAASVTSAKPQPAQGLLQGVPGTTVRLGYSKGESLRFISHLELQRELERALRRADVPVLYSAGFSPRPRISAGPALALGWTSDAEWIDVELAGTWSEQRLADLMHDLNTHVAPGITFTVAAAMPPKVESLVTGIEQSTYVARFPRPLFETSLGMLTQASAAFMAAPSVVIVRERKGRRREIDIRPLVHEFAVVAGDEVVLRLTTASEQSVKPSEVLRAALDLDGGLVPLIKIHKLEAALASGDGPTMGALARAEVTGFETRDTNYSQQPARDARGYPGGRSTC